MAGRPEMSFRAALLAIALASSTSLSSAEVSPGPLISGIDPSAMDKNVRPQDDLFRYVNGAWLENTPFPAEYASAGIGIMLFEKAQEDVHAILLEAAAAGEAATPGMRRLGDMYASFIDEKLVDERGIAPLAPIFAEITAIDGPAALARFFGRAQGLGIDVPLGTHVYPDARNSTHNVAYFSQTGLGMPNRDYFLRDEDTYVEFRRKYVDYLAKLLTLAGEPGGAERAAKILELETRIARDQWTPVQNRDPIATYNRHGLESAAQLAPAFDWSAFHAASGLPPGDFIVRQPSYATALGGHLGSTELAVWKDYLKVRTIGAYARLLPPAFVEASFDFNSRTLRGTEVLRPRWKRAVQEVDGAMGEAIGAAYVARHFPPEAKQRMDQLVRNLLAAFDRGIDALDWMSAPTRTEAHAKLAKIRVKIAYPDKWRDYTGLEIRRDDLLGNVMRA
ncbi:MAG TPA: M13 family metallopeptidase N-terminal domain-containing protein, partial [Steroidobacteraceae bacterium]|nr:M13 family metallopeptidase N-terminal domain-containing protein [Steroidobacteraceae bacterium]